VKVLKDTSGSTPEIMLQFNVSEPLAPFTGFVGVEQPDFSFIKLPFTLEVCGYEKLSTLSVGPLQYFQADLQGESTLDIELGPLFVNDSPDNSCPITSFELKAAAGLEGDLPYYLYSHLSINGTHLIISEYTPVVNFAVMAVTANGNKAWQEFNVAFDPCGSQEVSAYENPLIVNVTRNSGTQVKALNQTAMQDNFKLFYSGVCPVTSYNFTPPTTYSLAYPYLTEF
jgi:hypothetical protein